MPAATKYIPDDRTLRTLADDEFAERTKLIGANAKYYRGEHKKWLKVEPGMVDDNITVNLLKQAIDRLMAFAVADFPKVNLDTDDSVSVDEKALREMLDQGGDAAVLLKEIIENGAIAGQAFVRIVEPKIDGEAIRIVPMAGERVIKFWDSSDIETVLWYELRWMEGKTERRQDIVAIYPMDADDKRTADTPTRWEVIEYQKAGGRWERITDQPFVWNHPLGPILDVQHLPKANKPYGLHEFEPAALNDQYNKAMSDNNKALRFHSGPRTIGTGFQASAVQETAVDDFWTIPDKEAQVFNLEMSAGALVPSMEFCRELKQNFFDEMRVVMDNAENMKAMTATEIKARYTSMMGKIKTLWAQYGKLLVGIIRRILMLKGKVFDGEINLEWVDPLPMDEMVNTQIVKAQLDMGLISKATAAKKLGIDYDREVELMKDENEEDSGRVIDMTEQLAARQPQAELMPMRPVMAGVN